jgi:DNA gyrase subunit A
MEGFGLTEIQAQAILDLRLQRLTNLEIETLRKEYEDILKLVAELESILASERKLMNLIKKELRAVADQHGDERRTQFLEAEKDKLPEIVKEQAILAEETALIYTRGGFIKRVQPRVLQKMDDFAEDAPGIVLRTATDKKLLFFTDRGNVYTLPVNSLPENKPKDRGALPGALLEGLEDGESILALYEASDEGELLFITQRGMVKRTERKEYGARKGKLAAINLREGDLLLKTELVLPDHALLLVTERGMSIHFALQEIPTTGRATGGVKGIAREIGDRVAAALQVQTEGELLLMTDRGYAKRNLLIDHDRQGRGGKGLKAFNFNKNGANGSIIAAALWVREPFDALVYQKDGTVTPLNTEEVLIEQRFSKGKPYVLALMENVVVDVMPKEDAK